MKTDDCREFVSVIREVALYCRCAVEPSLSWVAPSTSDVFEDALCSATAGTAPSGRVSICFLHSAAALLSTSSRCTTRVSKYIKRSWSRLRSLSSVSQSGSTSTSDRGCRFQKMSLYFYKVPFHERDGFACRNVANLWQNVRSVADSSGILMVKLDNGNRASDIKD